MNIPDNVKQRRRSSSALSTYGAICCASLLLRSLLLVADWARFLEHRVLKDDQRIHTSSSVEGDDAAASGPDRTTTAAPRNGYYQFWDSSTNKLDLPTAYHPRSPSDDTNEPPTSLQILEQILTEMGNPDDYDSYDSIDDSDECFRSQVETTASLAAQVSSSDTSGGDTSLAFPFLNVGMPKSGSTTLESFFTCSGFRASHSQNGVKMKELVDSGSAHPLRDTQKTEQQAYLQMDSNYGTCVFPQIQFLDELHQEYPNATMILMMRPVEDWIRSAQHWERITERWRSCELPGLICTGERGWDGKQICTESNLRYWWCSHVKHVREFVKYYPSHKLVEFDLYNNAQTSDHLSRLFGAEKTCWGHSNMKALKTSPAASETNQ